MNMRITADALSKVNAVSGNVRIFDLREEHGGDRIPGSIQLSPSRFLRDPELIRASCFVIIYLDGTDNVLYRRYLRRAAQAGITQIRFLEGGITAWKAERLPTVPVTRKVTASRYSRTERLFGG